MKPVSLYKHKVYSFEVTVKGTFVRFVKNKKKKHFQDDDYPFGLE